MSEHRKLGEICSLITDGKHGNCEDEENSGFYFLSAKDVLGGNLRYDAARQITKADFEETHRRTNLEPGDLLVTNSGTIGRMAIAPDCERTFRTTFQKSVAVLKPKRDQLLPRFFYYEMLARFLEIVELGEGTTQQNLLLGDLRKYIIRCPPLPEQRAIAGVLSSLDDKIDLLHRQNKTLEALAETLFRQWFVEEANDDWEEGTLADVAVNVRDPVTTANIRPEAVYVGLEHIDRRSIALFQHGLGAEVTSNKSAFCINDILFGKLRPYFHKVCISPFNGVCSTDILVIRARREDLVAYCLFAFFQDEVVEYANLGSGGTRMPRTDWNALSQFPVKVPEGSKLSEFNSVVVPALKKINYNLEQLRTLEKLRDTLLPKLMSGEVRVQHDG